MRIEAHEEIQKIETSWSSIFVVVFVAIVLEVGRWELEVLLASRMNQSQRSVASLDVDDIFGVRPALSREALERPAVLHQHLFDRGLMQCGIHRFAEARVAESAARAVDAHRRAVDDDAHGLRPANEEPGPRI